MHKFPMLVRGLAVENRLGEEVTVDLVSFQPEGLLKVVLTRKGEPIGLIVPDFSFLIQPIPGERKV